MPPSQLSGSASALHILTDLVEDPCDDGNYRLNIQGDDLVRLWRAIEKQDSEIDRLRSALRRIAHGIGAGAKASRKIAYAALKDSQNAESSHAGTGRPN